MPTFVSNGVTLYYKEEGNGIPLILLHGLTHSHLMLEQEMRELKEHFRVIALDLRGHGESEKPPSYKLEDHVQDVISLMDHLDIESANILGISMGSYIAQGVATIVPNRVEKLIIIVSKSNGKTSSVQELFNRYAEELEGLSFQEKLNAASKYIFYDLAAIGRRMKEELEGKFVMLTPEQQAAANKALEGFDFRPDLNKVTAKTLVISGKYDGLNPPELGREIASLIPDATFVEFEKSGHAPSVEEHEHFMEVVTNFLVK